MYMAQGIKVEKNIDNSDIIPIYYDYDLDFNPYETNLPDFEHLPSIYIYDRYYYRVLKIIVEEDGTEDYNKSIYFTNSDYGILKHEIYDDTILISQKILMRKNIIR